MASPEAEKLKAELKPRVHQRLADREEIAHRKRSWEMKMAAAWGLRWGLSRTGTLLLPPPARCARRALHRQVDGTKFQSIYSLDKLYPESKGVDTAWKVPVSPDRRDGKGGSSRC